MYCKIQKIKTLAVRGPYNHLKSSKNPQMPYELKIPQTLDNMLIFVFQNSSMGDF